MIDISFINPSANFTSIILHLLYMIAIDCEKALKEFHFTRIEIENYVDATAYTIMYNGHFPITEDMISCRILNDVIELAKKSYIFDSDMKDSELEFDWENKKAIVSKNNKKIHGLLHTGATVCFNVKT